HRTAHGPAGGGHDHPGLGDARLRARLAGSIHSGAVSMTLRVLLLGGTSEIGLAIVTALGLPAGTQVILAGRDTQRLESAGKALGGARLPGPPGLSGPPGLAVSVARYDATDVASHQAFADEVCARGAPDLVIAAAGVLIPQPVAAADVPQAASM